MSFNEDKNSSIWDLIHTCDRVEDIVKFNWRNRVRKVKTTENTVLLWAHFHREHEFFGWAINKREKLKMSGLPLLHAFVGPESKCYIVPDKDIESGKFKLSMQKRENKHRKLNKNDRNENLLDDEYSKLEPFFGSPEDLEQ